MAKVMLVLARSISWTYRTSIPAFSASTSCVHPCFLRSRLVFAATYRNHLLTEVSDMKAG